MLPWTRDGVVYQVYPRSFQDSDGDGSGDLAGIRSRLDHLRWLGADAVWLSPIYPSPMADGGYDVSDYEDVDPRFGSLEDLDALIEGAHARGLRLLLDIVPCHTSIEHPWFREHPDWYVWSDRDGPQNNWIASFGGPAWSRDEQTGRWYLHSFYPEQPDLNWRNPEVPRAVAAMLRGWRERGVDGFRLDAIDRLMKDPQLRDDPRATAPPPLPLAPEHATLEHVYSRDWEDIGDALLALRVGAGEDAFLVGEAYVPYTGLGPYLEHLDVCFGFELYNADWDAGALRTAIEAAPSGQIAWVVSNHDFPRLPTRVGQRNARAAAMLLLTLPGVLFVYQGDELGMVDGQPGDPPDDRYGRDPFRTPMAWQEGEGAGFTEGTPWLPITCPPDGPASVQAYDSDSTLSLFRDLIALRSDLGPLEFVDSAPGVLAFRRGTHLIALNVSDDACPTPPGGAVLRATSHALARPGDPAPKLLEPGDGLVMVGS